MTTMTTRLAPPEVEAVPFARVLVPYDGSIQAETALAFGIALAQHGAALEIVHVVDETPILSETATSVVIYDPTPLIEALEQQAQTLVDHAAARCRESGVTAVTRIAHGPPVRAIVDQANEDDEQLIVIGTHGRSGLPRTFLGSTTEGILRATQTPVLAVHATMAPPGRMFGKLLVAVDDSDPSDAAVAVAARLVRTTGARAEVCSFVDIDDIIEKAGTYGYDPMPFLDGMRDGARDVTARALAHGGFPAGSATTNVLDGEPARGIVDETKRTDANMIVIGSHGRRGLGRLFLGSVAEHVVRNAGVPALVVRSGKPPR